LDQWKRNKLLSPAKHSHDSRIPFGRLSAAKEPF
jgi:hypothetical protein